METIIIHFDDLLHLNWDDDRAIINLSSKWVRGHHFHASSCLFNTQSRQRETAEYVYIIATRIILLPLNVWMKNEMPNCFVYSSLSHAQLHSIPWTQFIPSSCFSRCCCTRRPSWRWWWRGSGTSPSATPQSTATPHSSRDACTYDVASCSHFMPSS